MTSAYDVTKDCYCEGQPPCGCPCHGTWRMAKSGRGAERPWTPDEMSVLYHRGFKHGACGNAMDRQAEELPWYRHGYADGRTAVAIAMQAFNARVGHVPNPLRGEPIA